MVREFVIVLDKTLIVNVWVCMLLGLVGFVVVKTLIVDSRVVFVVVKTLIVEWIDWEYLGKSGEDSGLVVG